jgi:UDP-GlcNAc:undecaprenyl-phosphate GlcNAc-1-phosphate transferase
VIPAALTVLMLSLLAALALTPAVSGLARRYGWVDRPDGRRKLHTVPVPRIGGVSVYLSFAFAAGLLAWVVPQALSDGRGATNAYVHLMLACGAVALIGLVDDLMGVSPWSKMIVQAAAATYLYFHGYQIRALTNPFGDLLLLGHLALPLTILWFVGMSNAFNLIDGLDGLAAGVAFFATISLFAAAALNEHWATAFMAAALGGALLGFLRYNFNPASVFLGDCGSLFVGFALAAFAIGGSMKTSAAIAVAAPLLTLALPIFDVVVSMLRRLIRGTELFAADRDHVHHRLLRLGLTPRRAVVLLYGVAAVLGSLSLATLAGAQQVLWAVGIVFVLVAWVGLNRLGYAEIGELQRLLLHRLVPDRRTMANNVNLLRLRESLAQAATFAEAWDELIDAVARLDGRRVELQLKPEWHRRLSRALNEGRPRQAFPCWSEDDPGTVPQWSWTVPMLGAAGAMGALVIEFDPGQGSLSFEPSHLLEAVTRGFSPATDRLLRAEVEEPVEGGRMTRDFDAPPAVSRLGQGRAS